MIGHPHKLALQIDSESYLYHDESHNNEFEEESNVTPDNSVSEHVTGDNA